jgi:hypothetical protein
MVQLFSRRFHGTLIALVAVAGAFALPAVADAKPSTFHRYEVIGDARYFVTGEQCPEGSDRSTAQTTVAITAGHEDEAENGTTTLDNDYLRFGIQRFECDGSVFTDSAFSRPGDDVTFTYTTSLSSAAVTGTLTTVEGRTVTVDISWMGLGRKAEVTNNKTKFPGFSGTFQGKRRDAVATGTVVYDGDTVVNGSTTNAELESLEDTNVTR